MRLPSKYTSDLESLKKDPNAIRQMLQNPETRTLLCALQSKDTGQLQSAARSALQGNTGALSSLLDDLARNPETSRAIKHLHQEQK